MFRRLVANILRSIGADCYALAAWVDPPKAEAPAPVEAPIEAPTTSEPGPQTRLALDMLTTWQAVKEAVEADEERRRAIAERRHLRIVN